MRGGGEVVERLLETVTTSVCSLMPSGFLCGFFLMSIIK